MEENLEITKIHARSFTKIAFRTLRNFFDYLLIAWNLHIKMYFLIHVYKLYRGGESAIYFYHVKQFFNNMLYKYSVA